MSRLIINNIECKVGNFDFLLDTCVEPEIYFKFLEAEQNLKVSYIDFAHKLRMAYEAFTVYETAVLMERNSNDAKSASLDSIKDSIEQDVISKYTLTTYKELLCKLCEERCEDYCNLLIKYDYLRDGKTIDKDLIRKRLKTCIRYLYDFGSKSSHNNNNIEGRYEANRDNCIKVIKLFHDFLCVYYGIDHKFDINAVPIRNYIPVDKIVEDSLGLSLEIGKALYVRNVDDRIGYYIFSNNNENINQFQRRDIETINKLWEDNFDDPVNIIRQTDTIVGSNNDYSYKVYSLPGMPMKLSQNMVKELSINEKLDIIKGLCRGVSSIHGYVPPMYHRNISPDAFYIFKIKNKYKTLLAKFDCAKDEQQDYTVFSNIEKKVRKRNSYFAPEVIASEGGNGVDWEKADIYSLGKTICFILTGEELETKKYVDYIDEMEINDSFKLSLLDMLDEKPGKRPTISQVINII